MKLSLITLQILCFGTLAAPMVAQTQIGGGTCSSASLNGTYALTLTGRQVITGGVFSGALQANGSATFDGLNKVTISGTENTNQTSNAALSWSGTYVVQANCAAVVTISTGASATLNIVIYNQGKDFLLTGSDSTYSYAGSGVAQPTGCSATTLNGAYTFNATGYSLNTTAISGVADAAGLLQFDGQGKLTTTLSSISAGSSSPLNLTGTYTLASNCLGSATLTDANSHSYMMSFSVYSVAAANTNFYATLAGASNLVISGAGHSVTSTACAVSSLNGTYTLTLSGRAISSAGKFAGSLQGIGTATFDGNGNVTLAGTYNTNLSQGSPFTFQGTYTLAANCDGTVTLTPGILGSFSVVVWGNGTQFDVVGSNAEYVYSGSGTTNQPVACATPTLSGDYSFTTNGFVLAGTVQNGAEDEAGVLSFDGQGNVTATYTDTQAGAPPVSSSLSGTYKVASGCQASATLSDTSGNSTVFNFAIAGLHGENLDVLAANSQFVRSGSAHSAFTNPSQDIGNVASYAYSATPAGSVFVLFGANLATRAQGASTSTLPTKLLNTTVTVNGELAPLFFVDSDQIDAQMPWDISGNTVASVIVTNGTSTSNAAAVYVPATGTPGLSIYLNNRAVVVNADGSLNSPTAAASVGDEVVVYFTGGGPVQAAGPLTTGAPSPNGLSPVTGDNSITVGAAQADVKYVGLTPGSIGLYQANFIVPQIAKGTYPLVVTIGGQASNNPVMTVSN